MAIKQHSTFILLFSLSFTFSCAPKKSTVTTNQINFPATSKKDLQFSQLLTEAKKDLDSTKALKSPNKTSSSTTETTNKDPSINDTSNAWKKSISTNPSTEKNPDFEITSHFNTLQKKSDTLKANTEDAKAADNKIELSYNNEQFMFNTKWQAGLAVGSDSDEGSFLLVIKATDDNNNQVLINIKNDFDASHQHLETLPVVGTYKLNDKDTELILYINKTLTPITYGELQIITFVNGTVFGFFTFGDSQENAAKYTGNFQGKIDIYCLPIYAKTYCTQGWEKF